MSGLLSQAELDACRAMQRASFDKTATVTRDPAITDAWAATNKDAWATLIGAPVAVGSLSCRISNPDAKLVQQYQGQLGNVPVYVLTCDVGSDLLKGDHVTVEGHTLFVHELLDPNSYNTAQRAIVAEKQ